MNFYSSTDNVISNKKNFLEKQRDNNFNQIVALNIQSESIKTKIEDLLKKQDTIEIQLNLLNELSTSENQHYLDSLNVKPISQDFISSLSSSALSGLTSPQISDWKNSSLIRDTSHLL